MENNIVTIDTNNYSIMAKAMGMEVDTNSSDKSGSLARLKIEHKPIMGTAEVKVNQLMLKLCQVVLIN